MTARLEDEPLLAAADIQGNSLRGFDTSFLDLIGLKIDDPLRSRPWLRSLGDLICSVEEVHEHRLHRSANREALSDRILINAAFSKLGLDLLGFDTSVFEDGFFKKPMGALAGALGDRVENGQPVNYVIGKGTDDTPDVFLLIGSDNPTALTARSAEIVASAAAAGLRKFYGERGNVLPNQIEHFGFRDGISSPGPRGLLALDPPTPLTLRMIDPTEPVADIFGKPGQPLIWPGQFVFGYRTQSPTDPRASADPRDAADWMKNGSLLVFRRLKQDVGLFQDFLTTTSARMSNDLGRTISPEELGARIVGRWKDGTPVTVSQTPDAGISGNDMRVNHFAYGGIADVRVLNGEKTEIVPGHPSDVDGGRCPHFAHIRKVNPRDQTTNQGPATFTLLFQMLRRGIPYGPLFSEEPDAERGLLFLAYQTSFKDQFRELNTDWMNNPGAPELGDEAYDLLVGQNGGTGPRVASFHDANTKKDSQIEFPTQFVIPTGGAFLFTPSVSFFRSL